MANMAQLLADRSDPVKQKLAKFRDQCLTVAWWISQHAEDVLLTYFLADTPAAINSSIKRLKNLQKKYYQYRHEGWLQFSHLRYGSLASPRDSSGLLPTPWRIP